MSKMVLLSLALVALLGSLVWAGDSGTVQRWEYRVLSKDAVLELGNKDLVAGLNHVGRDGWELVAIDGGYIFKRPRMLHVQSVQQLKERLALVEDDVATRKERVAWTERMVRTGFMSKSQLQAQRSLLQQAEFDAAQVRRDLDALNLPTPKPAPAPAPAPAPKK